MKLGLGLLGLLCAFSVSAAPVCSTTPFGSAEGFNLFLLGNLTADNSRVEGTAAVGGDATLVHYSIGLSSIGLSKKYPYALVVGGVLTGRHGTVWGGPTAYGRGINVNETFTMYHWPYHTYAIDFVAAQRELTRLSDDWAALPATGSVARGAGKLSLSGRDADLLVFDVSAEDLASATFLEVDAPETATILVNVRGRDVRVERYGFKSQRQLVFNFSQADRLVVDSMGVPGFVIAPRADVTFNDAHIDGTLVAHSMTGRGHMRNRAFTGCLPVGSR